MEVSFVHQLTESECRYGYGDPLKSTKLCWHSSTKTVLNLQRLIANYSELQIFSLFQSFLRSVLNIWKKIWTFGMSLKSWLLLTKLMALAMSASFSLMLVPNLSKITVENLANHKTGMRMSAVVCFLRLLVKHCSKMTTKNKCFYTRNSEAPCSKLLC